MAADLMIRDAGLALAAELMARATSADVAMRHGAADLFTEAARLCRRAATLGLREGRMATGPGGPEERGGEAWG